MAINLVPRPETARPDHSQPRIHSAASAVIAGVMTAFLLVGVLSIVPADAAVSLTPTVRKAAPAAAPVVLPTIRVVASR